MRSVHCILGSLTFLFRAIFFLHTDNFVETYARFCAAGVAFAEEPRHEPYGTVAVSADPFGNLWDLIEPKKAA